MKIDCHIGPAKLKVVDGKDTFGYDTANNEPPDESTTAALAAIPAESGKKMEIHVYTDGTRVHTEHPNETPEFRSSPIIDSFESCFSLLPRELVGPNAKWTFRNEEYVYKNQISKNEVKHQFIERTRTTETGKETIELQFATDIGRPIKMKLSRFEKIDGVTSNNPFDDRYSAFFQRNDAICNEA